MLEIKNLTVHADGKKILHGLNLTLKRGEIHFVMGPNGAGKSTFAEALMGHPALDVSGSIKLDGVEMLRMTPDKRAKRGMFLAFQSPEEIEGVRVGTLIRKARSSSDRVFDMNTMMKVQEELVRNAEKLGLDKEFIERQLNIGFSGGEKKRLEMLQMMALAPKVIIMDEVDSGLDVDGVRLIAQAISELNDGTRCFLIITHYPRILKHIKPDVVHVLVNGRFVASGDETLAHEIEEKGYSHYLKKK